MHLDKLRHLLSLYTSSFSSFFLILIIILAVFLRLYRLDTLPFGALIDEASYGYSAYSILQTGSDELGNKFPLHFRAFGDEKLPLYAYTLAPIINVFGLSNFSVRLPSALAGIGLVLVAFVLIKDLYRNTPTALFSALVVAVSPWSLILSRFAFESNVALFLFAIAIMFFVKAQQKGRLIFLLLTSFFMALTWYTYIPYRLMTSVIMVILSILYFSKNKDTRAIVLAFAVFFIVVSPVLPHTLSSKGTTRFNQVGFIQNPSTTLEINEHRSYCLSALPSPVCMAFYNKPLVWMRDILSNQIQSLGTDFLFVNGENALIYLSIFNTGVLLLVTAPFYLLGLAHVFDPTISSRYRLGFIAALFIVLLPSALVGDPQRVRLSASFLLFLMLLSQGFNSLYRSRMITTAPRTIVILVTFSLIVFSGYIFASSMLLVHFQKFTLEYSGPTRGAIEYASQSHPQTDLFFSSNMNDAILHYAYYTRLNPAEYQEFAEYSPVDSGGFSHPKRYKNVYMESESMQTQMCKYQDMKRDFLYISLSESADFAALNRPPVYRYPSFDGQSYLAYVYHFDPKQSVVTPCK